MTPKHSHSHTHTLNDIWPIVRKTTINMLMSYRILFNTPTELVEKEIQTNKTKHHSYFLRILTV